MKHRCTNCNKLLAIGTGNFAIKCPRCKTLNQINTKAPEYRNKDKSLAGNSSQ